MKTNREIRAAARAAVRGKWFWRILFTFIGLNGLAHGVQSLLTRFNRSQGILSGIEYVQRKFEALQQGLDYALPTQEAYRQMFVASGLEYFVSLVLGSIALFGLTAVALRAMKKEEGGWLDAGVGGFRRPLDVTVLLLVQNLVVLFWSCLFVLPGIVMAYRYRFAWYLKCENPDWGTLKCLGESARLVKGHKWRAFLFDCHYLAQLFLVLLSGLFALQLLPDGDSPLSHALVLGLCVGVILLLFLTIVHFVAGRAAFYREVRSSVGAGGSAETSDSVPALSDKGHDLPGND